MTGLPHIPWYSFVLVIGFDAALGWTLWRWVMAPMIVRLIRVHVDAALRNQQRLHHFESHAHFHVGRAVSGDLKSALEIEASNMRRRFNERGGRDG